jgi:[acyl-carrier-protein] S-malonyltransferase
VGTSVKTALLFPGQGSQTPDMRDVVAAERPDLTEEATALAGADPFEHVEEGTRFAQPAIYCASIAHWERLGRPSADFFAGHSLGELAALAASGTIGVHDGLRAVTIRGRLMQEAAEANGGGRMLACRATRDVAKLIASRTGVTVANVNDPRQVVLSGHAEDIVGAAALLKEAGVRTKELAVRGAFHSPSMGPAAVAFRRFLADVEVRQGRQPVLRGATATPFEDVRAELAAALTLPVDWVAVLTTLHDAGVRRFVEPGPGRVLTGLVRRSLDGVDAEAAAELERAGA